MVKDIQFVTNGEGQRTGVLLSLEQYEAFQEWLDDTDVAEAAQNSINEPKRAFSEVVAEMRSAYEIDV